MSFVHNAIKFDRVTLCTQSCVLAEQDKWLNNLKMTMITNLHDIHTKFINENSNCSSHCLDCLHKKKLRSL